MKNLGLILENLIGSLAAGAPRVTQRLELELLLKGLATVNEGVFSLMPKEQQSAQHTLSEEELVFILPGEHLIHANFNNRECLMRVKEDLHAISYFIIPVLT